MQTASAQISWSYEILFLDTPSEFKSKVYNLIKKIGYDYVNIIENDLSILEKLL